MMSSTTPTTHVRIRFVDSVRYPETRRALGCGSPTGLSGGALLERAVIEFLVRKTESGTIFALCPLTFDLRKNVRVGTLQIQLRR